MNPTSECTSERNLLSEVDEIIATTKILLQAVANIGGELDHYKRLYTEISEKITVAIDTVQIHIDAQMQLNQRLTDSQRETLETLKALNERVSALETVIASSSTKRTQRMRTDDFDAWSSQELQAELEQCLRKITEKRQHLTHYQQSRLAAQCGWIEMMGASDLAAEDLECLKADVAADKPAAAFPEIDPVVENRIVGDLGTLNRRAREIRKRLIAR